MKKIEVEKAISLEGVRMEKKGDDVIFTCSLESRDVDGLTPCDKIAKLMEDASVVVTRNMDAKLFDAEVEVKVGPKVETKIKPEVKTKIKPEVKA